MQVKWRCATRRGDLAWPPRRPQQPRQPQQQQQQPRVALPSACAAPSPLAAPASASAPLRAALLGRAPAPLLAAPASASAPLCVASLERTPAPPLLEPTSADERCGRSHRRQSSTCSLTFLRMSSQSSGAQTDGRRCTCDTGRVCTTAAESAPNGWLVCAQTLALVGLLGAVGGLALRAQVQVPLGVVGADGAAGWSEEVRPRVDAAASA